MPVSEKSISQQASHQLYVIRVSSMTANKSDDFFDAYKRLALEIVGGLELGKIKTYTDTLKELLETSGYFKELQDEAVSDMEAFAAYEVGFQLKLFSDLFEESVRFAAPTAAQVMKLARNTPMILGERTTDVKTWQQMIDAIDESARDAIQAVVTRAYFNGDISGIRKATAQAVDSARNGVKATIRTMYQHLAAQSKQAIYAANDDIVIGYQIVATLDSRTTQICRLRDGKRYYFKDSFNPKLPFHYGERSTDVPVLSSEFEIDRSKDTRPARGADGGQTVPDSTSQLEFIKSQPAEWQDDALGKVRADILRNAGLTTEELRSAMSSQFDTPLTLSEMAAKDDKIRQFLASKPQYRRFIRG